MNAILKMWCNYFAFKLIPTLIANLKCSIYAEWKAISVFYGNRLWSRSWPDARVSYIIGTNKHWWLWAVMPIFMHCMYALQWHQYQRDGVWNHPPHDCLLNRLFRRRSNKTSKLRFTGLCTGNSPVTGEFPAQRASDAENVSIWWRHYVPWNMPQL